jgi:hypothetical protein
LLAAGALWLFLATTGCGTADPNLFGSGQSTARGGSPSAGSPNVGGSSSSEAGSGSAASTGGNGGETAIAGNTGDPPPTGGGGGGPAGCAFACGDGGRGGWSNGGAAGAAGVNDQAGTGGGSPECATFSADATYLPSTQHCYLVDEQQRTFEAAQMHCTELKGHLLTLSSDAENDFAWSLHSEEHWIGAKDGKPPKQPGVGTYAWVTDEPFDYTNWSPDQPNASKTDCVDGGACYEHCAFQWKGGERDGQWNDRYCMHTIASICEWDKVP